MFLYVIFHTGLKLTLHKCMMTSFVILVPGAKFENFHLLLSFLHARFFETFEYSEAIFKNRCLWLVGLEGFCED